MNQKRTLFLVVLVTFSLLGALVFAGGAKGEEEVIEEPKLKTITVGLTLAPSTFDVSNHRERTPATIAKNWTGALTQMLSDGQHVLNLAESITMVEPATYEIKIRKGVTFHNGDPMTADDVIFSITRVGIKGGMEGETSPRRSIAGSFVSAEKIDDYTVIAKLEKPAADRQVRNWYNVDILPKKYFEEVGVEEFLKHPIGVGPFKWVEGDITTHAVLERYENYWGGAKEMQGEVNQVPALDRVIFKFIPEATSRVAALLAGEVDIIQGVPFDSVKILDSNPNTRVESTTGTNVVHMAFNTTKAPFNDKRVRQAIGYAIDYDLLCEKLLLGFSDPLYGRPFMEPYKGEAGHGQFGGVKPLEYNPEKAKALLEEAGVGGFTTVIDTHSEYTEQAQAVAQMLADVGINASVRVWDHAVLMAEFKKGTRDIRYLRTGSSRKSPTFIEGLVGTGKAHNYALYSNPTLDEMMNKAKDMEDSPERNALYIEIFELVMDEMPILAIHQPRVVEACNNNVKNFYASCCGRVNLHRVDIE